MYSKKADTMVVKEVIELVIVVGLILLSVFVGYKLWGLFFGQKEDANTINNFNRLTADIDELLNSPESFAYKTKTYYIKDDYFIKYNGNSVIELNKKKPKFHAILAKDYKDKDVIFTFGKFPNDIGSPILLIGGSEYPDYQSKELETLYLEKKPGQGDSKFISIAIWPASLVNIAERKAMFEKTKCTDNAKITPPCYCGNRFVTEQNKYCCNKNNLYIVSDECCNVEDKQCEDGQITSCCKCRDKNYESGYCAGEGNDAVYIICDKIKSCMDYCNIFGGISFVCEGEYLTNLCKSNPCNKNSPKGCFIGVLGGQTTCLNLP